MLATKFQFDHDVIIIGAGPAGTSTAIRLAELGFNVGIVENRQFPRAHVGICLSDPTVTLLNYLAPRNDLIGTNYWPRNVTAIRWGTSQTNYVRQPGLHIDRGALDQSLLRKACLDGVSAYHPASLIDACSMDGGGWRIAIAVGPIRRELRSRFLVDATGRSSALSNVRLKDSPPLIALHADWDLSRSTDFDGLIEAGDNAWLWYAQTASRRASVSVFCAPQVIRERNNGDLQASYLHLLRQFRLMVACDFQRQASQPRARDATSRHSVSPVSDHHIRVGDACLSIDPLSSQGVHLALLSGIQAAIVINTILRKPENRELAKRFFCTRVAERVALYTIRTRTEYARVSAVCSDEFWHDRADTRIAAVSRASPLIVAPEPAIPGASVRVAPEVAFTREPVINGDVVEEHMCVRHPDMEGAIAFVEGMNLTELLRLLPNQMSYHEIPILWRDMVPASQSDKVRGWLWEKRILISADAVT